MKRPVIYLLLLVALFIGIALSLSLGPVQIPFRDLGSILWSQLGFSSGKEVEELYVGIINLVRWPRTILGILVGAALGVSGAAIQGVFRNPLAEPGLIGISAGASLVAAAIIAFEAVLFVSLGQLFGHYLLAIGAFTGAAAATWLVYRISLHDGKPHIGTMLLAGIAINALAGSLTGLISYLSDEQQLRTITFWMLGSLGGAHWEAVFTLLPFVTIALIGLSFLGRSLNTFSLGEQEARQLGQRPDRVKLLVIIFSTMAVGASVSVAGVIGFVGLLVPHAIRILGGADNRFVLPASAILGAATLTISDVIARTIAMPSEIPIGVVTSLLGTPVFLYILIRDKKKIVS